MKLNHGKQQSFQEKSQENVNTDLKSSIASLNQEDSFFKKRTLWYSVSGLLVLLVSAVMVKPLFHSIPDIAPDSPEAVEMKAVLTEFREDFTKSNPVFKAHVVAETKDEEAARLKRMHDDLLVPPAPPEQGSKDMSEALSKGYSKAVSDMQKIQSSSNQVETMKQMYSK